MEKGKGISKCMKGSIPSVDDGITTARQAAKRRSLYNGYVLCHPSCCCRDGQIPDGCDSCRWLKACRSTPPASGSCLASDVCDSGSIVANAICVPRIQLLEEVTRSDIHVLSSFEGRDLLEMVGRRPYVPHTSAYVASGSLSSHNIGEGPIRPHSVSTAAEHQLNLGVSLAVGTVLSHNRQLSISHCQSECLHSPHRHLTPLLNDSVSVTSQRSNPHLDRDGIIARDAVGTLPTVRVPSGLSASYQQHSSMLMLAGMADHKGLQSQQFPPQPVLHQTFSNCTNVKKTRSHLVHLQQHTFPPPAGVVQAINITDPSSIGQEKQSVAKEKQFVADHTRKKVARVCSTRMNEDAPAHVTMPMQVGDIANLCCLPLQPHSAGNHCSTSASSQRICTSSDKSGSGVDFSFVFPEMHAFYAPDDYIDVGDCSEVCIHCGAAFWNSERLKDKNKTSRPVYHGCCSGGKVRLPNESAPPEFLRHLLQEAHFLENIRAYNQMFAMTSFGAKVDDSINNGRSPYVFKLSGQIYHWIGSLCPTDGDPPRFLQLYIHDTHHEVDNRMRPFSSADGKTSLRKDIVDGLIALLDTYNDLIRLFRSARDKCLVSDIPSFQIKLYSVPGVREYELPLSDSIGAIVFESGPRSCTDYDVVIELKGGMPQRINKLHPSYMSLQFPLLFVYGQQGYHPGLKMKASAVGSVLKRMSMNAYYSYQIHQRDNNFDLLFLSGRLFQQYLVSVYCCIEQNRMDFLRANQNDIRRDYLSGVYDAISRGDRDGSEIGSRVILPSSFTGGPRYMYSHYLDALAICRVLGNPQFFITFTCNIKWPEIRRHVEPYPHLTPNDRADIVSRVFQQKVSRFIKYLHKERPFGTVTGVLYTIEFQKRGLPHCHTLLWLDTCSRIEQPHDVDKYISAEIPDPMLDPHGYRVISELMVHGPCGFVKPNAPCMQDGSCSKKFPKKYSLDSSFDKDGHIHYRRRESNVYVTKHSVKLDNAYVVPYNSTLCLTFYAHINVEYCGWSMLIKYLFKYISKGTDRVVARITRPIGHVTDGLTSAPAQTDEIQNFLDGRYICPHEAAWRILNFDIHYRDPAVQILSVHLEDMQSLHFRPTDCLESLASDPHRKKTTLTEWLTYNKQYGDGKNITYLSFPAHYVWRSDCKCWTPRKNKKKSSVGRIAYIHPTSGELFYLRLLLCHQKGCTCFRDIRTVNQKVLPTFRAACDALGLLGDDKEWEVAIKEASYSSTSAELRSLFVQIVVYCEVSDPLRIWNDYWRYMSDDIPIRITKQFNIPHISLSNIDLQGYVLYELEILFNMYGKSSQEYGLPSPPTYLLDCWKSVPSHTRNPHTSDTKHKYINSHLGFQSINLHK